MLKHVLLKVAVASFTFLFFAKGIGDDSSLISRMVDPSAFMTFFVVDMFRGFGVLASLLRTVMALIAGFVSVFSFMIFSYWIGAWKGAWDGALIGDWIGAAFVAAVVSEFVCSSWAKQEPSE